MLKHIRDIFDSAIEVFLILIAAIIFLVCFFENLSVLEKWQTLVTGIFAIIAAFIAAKPVWRQLRILEIQSATASREVLAKILSELEVRKIKTQEVVDKMTGDFWEVIYPFGDEDGEELPKINEHWAHHAESQVTMVLSKIRQFQEKRQDCNIIHDARTDLISSLEDLSNCLHAINLPVYVSMDFELELTKEDRDKINQDSDVAEKRLIPLIRNVSKMSKNLDEVFQLELEKYRDNIRKMDDSILNGIV